MKKLLIILVAALFLTACSKSNYNEVKYAGITLSMNDGFILQDTSHDGTMSFNIYDLSTKENLATGFIEKDTSRFDTYLQIVHNDEAVQEIFYETYNYIYYSVENRNNPNEIEYNRFIKHGDFVIFIGGFNRDIVDSCYDNLEID